MKIAFFYPAKLVLVDIPEKWVFTPVPNSPMSFATFDGYPWYCFKSQKVKSNPLSEGQFYLLLEIDPGLYVPITTTGDVPSILEKHAARLAESVKTWRGYLANPSLYGDEQTERRAKIKAEREAADKDQKEREERRAKAAQEAYEARLACFASGESQIPLGDFERACKEKGIMIPIQTVGWARENVKSVGLKSATLTGRTKHNSPHFWRAVRVLAEALCSAE